MSTDTDSTGTARVLHELATHRQIALDHDADVALSFTTKAIQRRFPDITKQDVAGCLKVVDALGSGTVSLSDDKIAMELFANEKTEEILETLMEMQPVPAL